MTDKPLEEKNIIERYTIEGKFNLTHALVDLENRNKLLNERVLGLEEAMEFFSKWYNETQRPNILISESLSKEINGESKIILK